MQRKINILHVDDSQAILLYIKIMLMEIPAIQRIESAGSIREAKEILGRDSLDVVILDINLPDGSGLEILEWIRKNKKGVQVIMFTNNADSFFRGAAQKAGADYFLDKSMEFEDLIKILKNIKIN